MDAALQWQREGLACCTVHRLSFRSNDCTALWMFDISACIAVTRPVLRESFFALILPFMAFVGVAVDDTCRGCVG